MQACFRHPDRPAVEHCEVCQRPVCGSCLWYAEAGERLCPHHGREWLDEGRIVDLPERYAASILASEASAATPRPDRAAYRGNSTDLGALVSAVSGLAALAACAGLAWLIPLFAFVLGLVGWLHSGDAVDPRRTRLLSGLGLLGGGGFLLFFFALISLCAMCYVFSLGMSMVASRPPVVPTPLATPTL